jgi:hypothetical protein
MLIDDSGSRLESAEYASLLVQKLSACRAIERRARLIPCVRHRNTQLLDTLFAITIA